MDEMLSSVAGRYAMRIVTSGNITYVAKANARIDSASTPKWRVMRVKDNGSGVVTVAFAGGDPGFKWPATDMASLTYPEY